jgi:hypothetical protein
LPNERAPVGLNTKETSLNKPSKDAVQAQAEAKFKRKEQQTRDGMTAKAEYAAAGEAMRAKTEKLRALRLAKEAADAMAAEAAPPPAPKAPKGKKRT